MYICMRSLYLYKQSFLRLLLFKFVMHSTQSNKTKQNKTKPRRINSIIVVNYLERHLSMTIYVHRVHIDKRTTLSEYMSLPDV